MRRAATAVLAFLNSSALLLAASYAQDATGRRWMTRHEIVDAFADKPLAGVYPDGRPWKELVRSDGSSLYEEAGVRREGRWTLADGRFCFTYDAPDTGGCFFVSRIGTNCFELYASTRLDPPSELGPAPGLNWNGRMWREDLPPTCDEKPTV